MEGGGVSRLHSAGNAMEVTLRYSLTGTQAPNKLWRSDRAEIDSLQAVAAGGRELGR